ncbi:MAG: hypothetical protein A2289_09320 [Deltaproteobacteria bacterium RIFOXYA12_FULL_58_15]|nr:MAG: hypothetical protein A2289_09320 [Deltaproteobacteria bacterium RIFOXYA12_FULL_58_15]
MITLLAISALAMPVDNPGMFRCVDAEWAQDDSHEGDASDAVRAAWLAWRSMSLQVVPRNERPDPTEVVDVARSYLGTPYTWGGVGEGGFDCSGFVNKVFAQLGYDLPRTSREQFKVGVAVASAGLVVGDLVFFTSSPGDARITHVGIYAGEGDLIHAATGKGEVTYDSLRSHYYAQRWVGGRRILALPPGVYSTRTGAARAGVFFENVLAIGEHVGEVDIVYDDDEIGQLILELTEHGEDERPIQLARRGGARVIDEVGPRLLRHDRTGLAMRLGAGRFGGSGGMLAAIEGTYFGDSNALKVMTSAAILLPIGDGNVGNSLAEQWSDAHDFTKLLSKVSYGQPESRFYLDVGRTASATLGQGQLLRNYTPNIVSPVLPSFVSEPDALSLSFAGEVDEGGAELFVDDLFRPQVAAVRLATRPLHHLRLGGEFFRALELSATYAVDSNAPNEPTASGGFTRARVHGLGMTAQLPLLTGDLGLEVYGDCSGLVYPQGAAMGGAVGTSFAADLGGGRHRLRSRFELRVSGASFLPSYFDATYRINRAQAPVADDDTLRTKVALLEALEGGPARWGLYGELAYVWARRLNLGMSFEDGSSLAQVSAAQRHLDRSLMFFVEVQNLYLPQSSRQVHLYLAYHLRNFEELRPLFFSERTNEYIFVAASVDLGRYLSLGGVVRKAARPKSGEVSVDALLDLTLHYEI